MSIDLPSIDKKTMSNLPENRVKIEISKEGEVLINNTTISEFSLKSLNEELSLIPSNIRQRLFLLIQILDINI